MLIAQLASSPFFGGPERQMLGLALALPAPWRTLFVGFPDRGKSAPFRRKLEEHGLETAVLAADTPRVAAMARELAGLLGRAGASLVCCHGFKADLIGLMAARRAGLPAISVSRGWTRETWKVRAYEAIDRACLRRMDRVVCVSHGQATRVRNARVAAERVVVIPNAVRADRFLEPDPSARAELLALFPRPPARIVGSAGRLSPEKGFGVLVEAAAVVASDPGVGFVHFGDGVLREPIARRIEELGLRDRFILAGFRGDLDRFFPHWDLMVLPSFTEGMPNVVLEAFAAGVPVVATAVGGTPELVADGVNGYLVAPGDPDAIAARIRDVLGDEPGRSEMGRRGRELVGAEFTFEAQARHYLRLLDEITARSPRRAEGRDVAAP